ncbi:MAG: GNAT family N-acetyltransferase [Alphaproteobacteria bacterium]|nr:GNAT family N-acetyltransferase [Alphaproteobacteria bacterium]
MQIIRDLLPADSEAIVTHLSALDAEDRRLRFGASVSDEAIAEYVGRIAFWRAGLIGQFDDGRLIGLAELIYDHVPGLPSVARMGAELAVTVLPEYRNQGVASELLRRTLVCARNRNVSAVTMMCLLENRQMRHLASKFDAALHFEDGMVESQVDLERPNGLSYAIEAIDRSVSAFGTVMDQLTPRTAEAPADGTTSDGSEVVSGQPNSGSSAGSARPAGPDGRAPAA